MFVSPESSPGRNFYPRPPRGGRHHCGYIHDEVKKISIHALREEGDRLQIGKACEVRHFYPRPPRGGRRVSPVVAI